VTDRDRVLCRVRFIKEQAKWLWDSGLETERQREACFLICNECDALMADRGLPGDPEPGEAVP
jgi:hypothetical protein